MIQFIHYIYEKQLLQVIRWRNSIRNKKYSFEY